MYPTLKRFIDIAASGLGLVAISPLLLIISLWIRLDSPGPVLYTSERIGKDGKPFRLLKFRSMRHTPGHGGASSTPDDDPRITPVGRRLRMLNLDQLPELINVFKGDMSLVGPRPQVRWAVELYDEEARSLLSVRPGMTDYASISFNNEGEILRGSTDPDKDYMEKIWPEKRRLGLEYVRSYSLWVDTRILVNTLLHVRK